MNTRLVNTAAGVINAAMVRCETAAGIALALESTQMLMSPETAAELEGFRALELADIDGRVSASCPEPGHATWLRAKDDVRGCPWCRVAELEAAPATVYRAEHPDSGITLGHYGTETAARAHCEATERRSWLTGTSLTFDWIEDDEDRVAELVVTAGQNEESTTGYIVTALELDSEYDEAADE